MGKTYRKDKAFKPKFRGNVPSKADDRNKKWGKHREPPNPSHKNDFGDCNEE
jgi:hypothetical protein